jgi:hypothetical protein
MTIEELMRQVLALFPNAIFDEDVGEIVIYTGLICPIDWEQRDLPLQSVDDVV